MQEGWVLKDACAPPVRTLLNFRCSFCSNLLTKHRHEDRPGVPGGALDAARLHGPGALLVPEGQVVRVGPALEGPRLPGPPFLLAAPLACHLLCKRKAFIDEE